MSLSAEGSSGLFAQYLSATQKRTIVDDLIPLLQYTKDDANIVKQLCELLENPYFEQVKAEVFPEIKNYCVKTLAVSTREAEEGQEINETFGLDFIIQFSNALDDLEGYLIDLILKKISVYLDHTSLASPGIQKQEQFSLLIQEMKAMSLEGDISDTPTKHEVALYFTLLEKLISGIAVKTETAKRINVLACIYVAFNDEVISQGASRIFRWLVAQLAADRDLDSLVWDVIFHLVSDGSAQQYHNSIGYVFWIRYLTAANKEGALCDSLVYQNLVKHEAYWSKLQQLLVNDVHEYRKYALSIVQLSVQALNGSFENSIMKWDMALHDQYIQEWKRFCVLYEIVGIDTSLHQVQAGYEDIQRLLDPYLSKIHSSWGLSLVSTAITAPMDSVRKYGLELVLSISNDHLLIFDENGVFFLNEIFLSFALQALHFSIVKSANRETCPFGDALAAFIENILLSLHKAGKNVSLVAELLLRKLVDTTSDFEYGRMYFAIGILKGLNSFDNCLSLTHIKLLETLFTNTFETDIMETFLQTIYLRLLLNIDSKKLSLLQLIGILGKFVQINNYKHGESTNHGYVLYNASSEFFLDYISTNYPKEQLKNVKFDPNNYLNNIEALVIYIHLACVSDSAETPCQEIPKFTNFPFVLSELTYSGLDGFSNLYEKLHTYYTKFVNELSNNLIKNTRIWNRAPSIVLEKSLFPEEDENLWENHVNLKKLWVCIAVESQSTDVDVVELAVSKLRFFSVCYDKMKYLVEEDEDVEIWGLKKFEEIVKIANNLFKNLNKNQIDYKVRDDALSSVFKIVLSFLKVHLITPTLKSEVFDLIRNNGSLLEFKSQLAVINVLKYGILNTDNDTELSLEDIHKTVGILKQIWISLCQDRLKLNQRTLHTLFIDLLFDSKILMECSQRNVDDLLVNDIVSLGYEIIEQAYARRSFLPSMASKLLTFQLEHPLELNNSEFLAPLLVKIFSFTRSNSNTFKFMEVSSSLYDKVINYSTGSIYEQAFGPEEECGRIKTITILASLGKNSKLATSVFNYIVSQSADQFHLFAPVKRVNSEQQWIRIQLYSVLIVLSSILDTGFLKTFVDKYFVPAISLDASPIVRVYIEWLIGVICFNDTKLIDSMFERVADASLNPSILMSYERICFLICQELDTEKETYYLRKLIPCLISYCTMSKVTLRHFSASLICCVKNELDRKSDLIIPPEEKDIVLSIYNAVTANGKIDDYRSGDAMLWNLQKDLTLVGVCGGVLMRVSDNNEIDFINSAKFEKHLFGKSKSIQNKLLALLIKSRLHINIGSDDQNVWLLTLKQNKKIKPSASFTPNKPAISSSDKVALQKKSGAWRIMDPDNNNDTSTFANIKRSQLIVMGSLVDKPPNLGGICRLCDVLGAGLLTLGDIKYKSHPHFRTVAVTADLWLPMKEVKPEGIVEYLRQQKRLGYTLIGLEQTDKSVQLNHDLKFPEKSLIVLGKEKEGIPGDILVELDFCVEIKQVGVVRSMNIQTATALIVHAYSLQYC